ncbi:MULTISPECIES: branched-chain amino acid ABC transporter permease [unclassified Micromonospora]|uniref:branched-chain amino acid ABC transporter permease n=1 Tax=unclassified Micromonospora TaxID=2617518 RepID=UPI001375AE61|nr:MULTISPECIES: branched-chain amino acid ABC transporter permease [unclassified Micromonospora]QKW13571.1 branched-chain amino acid ABC transporter permease [Verrucosispora sp. NA02020]
MPLAQLVVSGVLIGALYSLIAVGLNLVFGVLRVVNFAHGELVMLSMFAAYFLHQWWNIDPFLSVLITAPAGFLLGALVYVVVLRPIMGKGFFVQVFATLGLSLLLLNGMLYLVSGTYRTVTTSYTDNTVRIFGTVVSTTRLAAFGVAVVVALALWAYLHHTTWGRAIRATAQDPAAASTLGISVDRIYLLTVAVSAAIAAVAGSLLVPIIPIYPGVGEQLVLVGFVVVVLGGLGSFGGALAGGLLIGVIETVSGYFIGEAVKQACYFIALIIVLLLRPAGLFGTRGAEEFRVA